MHPKTILIQISIPVNEITYCMHCSSLGILNPYIFMVYAFVCVCVSEWLKIQKQKEFAFDPGSAGCPRAWQAVTHAAYRKF